MDFEISAEFFDGETCNPKRGGPYKKEQKIRREEEVYRLHFELGYSASKIAEMMKVNRKTIISDINRFHDKLHYELYNIDLESMIMRQLRRLDLQRQRLMSMIGSNKVFSEGVSLEKLVFGMDCKILAFLVKMKWGEEYVFEEMIKRLNAHAKDEKMDLVWIPQGKIFGTTHQTRQKIRKLVKEDKKSKEIS